MFVPESEIASVYLPVELGGVLILLIELILGVLILILFIIALNCHSHPFSQPRSLLL